MASATVVFHRLAVQDYRTALRWYARRGVAVAHRFRAAVDQVIQQIASAPQQGTIFQGPYRWMRTRRFPYILYYESVDPTEVRILAVAHAGRRPGYWLRRTR